MCARPSKRRASVRFGSGEPRFEDRGYRSGMIIGVISDTHIYPHGQRSMPEEIPALFARFGCGLILHCGDCCEAESLLELSMAAPVLVVEGNNDLEDVRRIAELERTFLIGTKRIAMLHGHGTSLSARAFVKQRYAGKADLVLYGHSHIPMIEETEGTIFFNPGSATDRRWHPHFGIGVIRVSDEQIDPELILFTHPRELADVNPR